MRILLSHESGCARSFVTRCAIGRNLARPFVIDVSPSSASQLVSCREGWQLSTPFRVSRERSVGVYFEISLFGRGFRDLGSYSGVCESYCLQGCDFFSYVEFYPRFQGVGVPILHFRQRTILVG
jgi:hypothetical protein